MAIDLNPANELQWVKEGRVWSVQHGALTTPAAFETDLVRQTFDWGLRIPAGTVIVPLRISVMVEATGAAVFQCLISSGTNDPGTTGKVVTAPLNQNSRFAGRQSPVFGYTLSSGSSGTAPANPVDLHRVYVQPRIDAITGSATFEQVVYDPLYGKGLVAVIGDNSSFTNLLVMVGNGTSSTGYVLGSWAVWTYEEFYAA